MKLSGSYLSRLSLITVLFLLVCAIGTVHIYAAPEGGDVTEGKVDISQQEDITDINQSTEKAAINWQRFGIKAEETVNFNQPGVDAITLNRVLGNEQSVIDGVLNADGQVWVLNSSGVLFGENAKVNTSGILATTKNLSDEDFIAGNYEFTGDSQQAVINRGKFEVDNTGYAALLGKEVVNEGLIKAELGQVHLRGGREFRLDLNGNSLVNLTVTKGELNALVENKEAIRADGGEVYLTTNAVDELIKGAVNNEGIVEANSIADVTGGDGESTAERGEQESSREGKIVLFAHGGKAYVDGRLEASASNGGDGGFIETSGREVNIKESAEINTSAISGKTGNWLIDPTNFVIEEGSGDETNSSIGATTLENNLANSNIEIQTVSNGSEAGDIKVNADLDWDNNKLTLTAHNDIIINSVLTLNDSAEIDLNYGWNGDSNSPTYGNNDAVLAFVKDQNGFNGSINQEKSEDDTMEINNQEYKIIRQLGSENSESGKDLQGIAGDLEGNYVLGTNINASDTIDWDYGFNSISVFEGNFDGLGNTIDELHNSGNMNIGLFGKTSGAIIKNVGLTEGDFTAETGSGTSNSNAGGLVGVNDNSTIINSFSTVDVTGSGRRIGGLVGNNTNDSMIKNSYAQGEVKGEGDFEDLETCKQIGGLVGMNENSEIKNSYATGTIRGPLNIGGLVGILISGSISDSYASGDVSGEQSIGGLVGSLDINPSYSDVKNSFYNIDEVKINGKNQVTTYGIFNNQFNDWMENKNLIAEDYFDVANDGAYHISNIEDMKELLAFSRKKDYKFRLMSDINFAKDSSISQKNYFVPVLFSDFDGNQKQLSNLELESSNLKHMGLFGYAEETEITDLTTENLVIKNTNSNKKHSPDNVGSLVGKALEVHIENVHAKKVNLEGTVSGGLIGSLGEAFFTISKSSTSGTIKGVNAGGLVGGIMSSSSIENSFSTAEVNQIIEGSQSEPTNLGGLVGFSLSGTKLNNSYFTGKIDSNGDNIGGLIGYRYSPEDDTINSSYYDQTINPGMSDEADYGKTTEKMQDIDTFKDAGWDITADDTLQKNYPELSAGDTIWVIGLAEEEEPGDNGSGDEDQEAKEIVRKIVNDINNASYESPFFTSSPGLNKSSRQVTLSGVSSMEDPEKSSRVVTLSELGTSGDNGQETEQGSTTDQDFDEEDDETATDTEVSAEPIIVELTRDSLVQIVNGGVNLPEGIEQIFFTIK